MTSASALPTLMETCCARACDRSAEKPGRTEEVNQARCLVERGRVAPPLRPWASFGREESLDVGAMRRRITRDDLAWETGPTLKRRHITTSPALQQGQFGIRLKRVADVNSRFDRNANRARSDSEYEA